MTVRLSDSFQWRDKLLYPDGSLRRVSDMSTVYAWGANLHNARMQHGRKLMGGGMASEKGPTGGRAHAHYVGIVSILYPEHNDTLGRAMCAVEDAFDKLHSKLRQGFHIEFPRDQQDPSSWSSVAQGHGIGKGIAAAKTMSKEERADYDMLQKYIKRKIHELEKTVKLSGRDRERAGKRKGSK